MTALDETTWTHPIDTDDDEALRVAVVDTLGAVLDEAPEPDDDGDVAIWLDDVLTYASVDAEAGIVDITTYLVESITGRTRAAEVLGDLQLEFPEFKFVLRKDRVTAEQRVGASPLVPLHLVRAVAALPALVGQARAIAARLGGEACVFDGEEDPEADENLLVDECGCGDCSCG